MIWNILPAAEWILIVLCSMSTCYVVLVALIRYGQPARRALSTPSGEQFPVSVLKPLCGSEPRLYTNLRTFFEQSHPCFQLVFGVSSELDPAASIVRRLHSAYPDVDITLVVDEAVHGSNYKVSNLINLEQHARYGLLVVADSDIAVQPDYLTKVTAPLDSPMLASSPICTGHGRWLTFGLGWARFLLTNGSHPRSTSRMRQDLNGLASAPQSPCDVRRSTRSAASSRCETAWPMTSPSPTQPANSACARICRKSSLRPT
jgi:Glycosyl transferase family 21